MGFFSSVKKKISSSYKKSSKKNTKKNIKTRTLTPYNKLDPIEEENESLNKSSTPKSISIKVKSKSPQTIEEFKLKFPEPLPDKINFDEKVAKKMSALIDKHEDIKPFIGNILFENLFYLYLFKKYKTGCLITDQDAYNQTILEIRLTIDRDKPNINDERLKDLAKKLVKCISQNEPVIIIPLGLVILVKGESEGHSNLLIYRNNTRQLEHFEPHGSNFKGFDENTRILVNDVLDKDLDYLVKNMNDELVKKDLLPITLIKAHEVCPRILGVQVYESRSRLKKLPIEPGGYCSAWSMFFTEMCLKNPEISSKQIYKAILDERDKQSDYNSKFKKLIRGNDYNNYFKKIIRGYTCFINNKMAKYFTEILGFEITSEKLYNYSNNPEEDKIVKDFLYKLNGLINKEVDPDYEIDIRKKDMKDITDYYNTSKKYNTFKKTVRKSTSSSDLSPNEKESRRHTKKLKEDYDTKLSEFVKKDKEEKEQKATEKLASKTAKTKAKTITKSKTQTLKIKTTSEEV
jgi:hypothetical protein